MSGTTLCVVPIVEIPMKMPSSVPLALVLLRTFFWAAALLGFAQAAKAQTAFERLFDPRNALTIILEMPQETWAQIASEQPDGGKCNEYWDPSKGPRYKWHKTNATIITEGESRRQELHENISIKKRSYCGSYSNIKPSLALKGLAETHLGTTRLSLGNSLQDLDLFRQCAANYVFRHMDIPAPMCSFAALY
jgi:hypothetical protein